MFSDQFVSRLFRERGRKANKGLPQQHQNNRVLEITSQTRVISKAVIYRVGGGRRELENFGRVSKKFT